MTKLNSTVSNTLLKYNPGDIAFTLFSTVTLWMLVPGCGFMYNGCTRRHHALTMLILVFFSTAITFIQWWAIGYSLVFSKGGSPFIGNFNQVFLIGVYDDVSPALTTAVPELAFCLYQGVTAALGPAMIFGIIAERGRILPALVFCIFWTTFVYDFVAYWAFNKNGWAARIGLLDFGGGTPVHVPVGGAALAYTYLLGRVNPKYSNKIPHSMSNVFLGLTLCWIASFGYSGGSAFQADMNAIMACVTTNLAGAAGGLVWSALTFTRRGYISAFDFCMGSMSGLIAIVPAAGFISASSGFAVGTINSAVCYAVYLFKDRFFFEDVMEVFILNGVAGMMGNVLTGVFAQKSFGGAEAGSGGWLDGHWIQVPIQLTHTIASFSWSFAISYLFLFSINKTKALRLRVSESEEMSGIDEAELGIRCYEFINEISPFTIEKISKSTRISNGSAHNENGNEITNIRNGLGQMSPKPIRNNWIIN